MDGETVDDDELVLFVPSAQAKPEEVREYTDVSIHKTKMDAVVAMARVGGGEFLFKFNDGARATTYHCLSHLGCNKYMRVVVSQDGSQATLQESGVHKGEASDEKKRGISVLVKPELEAVLCGGAGPAECLTFMELKYKNQPEILDLLPHREQLKNLKAQLRSNMEVGWEIQNPAQILEWASGCMCESPEDFFGSSSKTFDKTLESSMDDLVALRLFEHEVEVDGKKVKSFGLIFSSRSIFLNVKKAVVGQASGILGAADGTYKIHFGGWTLVNFGTYSTRFVKGVFSKHYVPFTFMFVRTEHSKAYEELFSTTQHFARLLFGVELSLALGSLDHSAAIAKAFRAVWPSITLMTCWPHLVRKAKEQIGRLKDKDYFDSTIHPHLDILHSSRSQGPVPAAFVGRADGLASNPDNFMLLSPPGAEQATSIVFNADEFVNKVGNPHRGVKVTKARMTRYTSSLSGKLGPSKPIAEAKLLYQSLHRVLILSYDCPQFVSIPIWRTPQIEQVRKCFRCDCIDYMQSGWICEHILAAMAILGFMTIKGQTDSLPVKKSPGGQFKSRGPLQKHHKSKGDAQYFSASRLTSLLVECPTTPIHWRIVHEFPIDIDGVIEKEHVQGVVRSWLENKGRYKWRVEFANGQQKCLYINTLATAISYSHSIGTRVILPSTHALVEVSPPPAPLSQSALER